MVAMTSDYVDLTCVVHLHSTYSDGTGTVDQIARAAGKAGVDVVLLTDHHTLAAKRRGEERWYDDVLVLVGMEVTPPNHDHFLAFDIDETVSNKLSGPEICQAVHAQGGFGFGAHPWSRGNEHFRRSGYPWRELDCLDGVELWSFLNDTAERIGGVRDVLRLVFRPQSIIGGPPPENLRDYDRLCQARRVVAIGGLDAHQFGIRIAGHVPIRLMGYARTFKQLHTHVLLDAPLTHEFEADRARVYEALREGRCYIANDRVAPASGFTFWADAPGDARIPMGADARHGHGIRIQATLPRAARIRLLRNGELVTEVDAASIAQEADAPGVYRIEAAIEDRPWIYSNPVYLRP